MTRKLTILPALAGRKYLALILAVAILSWSFGINGLQANDPDIPDPAPIQLSHTISDSAPEVPAMHEVEFTFSDEASGFEDIDYITINFHDHEDEGTSFDLSGIGENEVQATTTDGTEATFSSATVAEDYIQIAVDDDPGNDTEIRITIGDPEDPGSQIVNPEFNETEVDGTLNAETYVVTTQTQEGAGGFDEPTQTWSRDTRLTIIDDVVMQAAVDTIFEFSVSGLDSDADVNGVDTTGASTPTSLDFGTIEHDEFVFLGHELHVNTNASNGFIVTLQESQELTSSTGERIHRFQNTKSGEEGTVSPTEWASPAATLDEPETYGHYGVITADEELEDRHPDDGNNDFGPNHFVGNFHQEPRELFGHDGPVTDENEHSGRTRVGVGLEISSLQAAGDDYTNTLTYVATPTF